MTLHQDMHWARLFRYQFVNMITIGIRIVYNWYVPIPLSNSTVRSTLICIQSDEQDLSISFFDELSFFPSLPSQFYKYYSLPVHTNALATHWLSTPKPNLPVYTTRLLPASLHLHPSTYASTHYKYCPTTKTASPTKVLQYTPFLPELFREEITVNQTAVLRAPCWLVVPTLSGSIQACIFLIWCGMSFPRQRRGYRGYIVGPYGCGTIWYYMQDYISTVQS